MMRPIEISLQRAHHYFDQDERGKEVAKAPVCMNGRANPKRQGNLLEDEPSHEEVTKRNGKSWVNLLVFVADDV